MRPMLLFRVLAIATLASITVFPTACRRSEPKGLTKIRLGWQIPLATQGQIVEVLKHTDLLEKNGLDVSFVPFSYGGPQSEAALAGDLDVIFVGDQPVINLLASGGRWKIVSRLFYTRTALMVPGSSPIAQVKDLRGKTVATPFGSVAHRFATTDEAAAGLNPASDVRNVNLDILEISNLVQAGGTQSWGKINAVGVWEPTTSLFELQKLARILDSTRTLGVVSVSDDFLTKYPDASVQFLEAVLEAWAYYATHVDQVNQWYITDARLSYDAAILRSAASVEPNQAAKSLKDVDLTLSEENIRTMEVGAAWAYQQHFTKVQPDVRAAVDQSILRRAVGASQAGSFELSQVGVKP